MKSPPPAPANPRTPAPLALLATAGIVTLAWRGMGLWSFDPTVWLAAAAFLAAVTMAWRRWTPTTRDRVARGWVIAALTAAAGVWLGVDPTLWLDRATALFAGLALGGGALSLGAALYARLDPVPPPESASRPVPPNPDDPRDRCERIVLSAGLGAGLLSLAALGLGLAGWMNGATVWLLPAWGWGRVAAARWRRSADGDRKHAASETRGAPWGEAVFLWRAFGRAARGFSPLTAAMALSVTAAAAATGPGALLPPVAYDVVEYHAQLPKEYVERGALGFLPHNAFSGFPQQMEMLSYTAFVAAGHAPHPDDAARSRGVWLAQLLHGFMLPLLLIALGLIAARLVRRFRPEDGGAVWWPALAALATPGTIWMAGFQQLYVETGMAALGFLALLSALRTGAASTAERPGTGRGWVATGLLLGAALGCKYTAAPFLAVPLFLFVLAGGAGGGSFRRRATGAGLMTAACLLAFSPWPAKNALTTGNPVYPLYNQMFGVRDWDEARERRMTVSHQSTDFSTERFFADWSRLVFGRTRTVAIADGQTHTYTETELGVVGWLLLPGLLPLLWAFGRSRRAGAAPETVAPHGGEAGGSVAVVGLLAWLAALLAMWFFLTHRMERFFHFGQMMACLLSGAAWAALALNNGTGPSATEPARALATARRWGAGALILLGMTAAWESLAGFWSMDLAPGRAPTVGQVLTGAGSAEAWLRAAYGPADLRARLSANVAGSSGAGAGAGGPPPLPPDAKVLLIGAADPFWLPAGRYGYAVVFSPHPVFARLAAGTSASEVARELADEGYTHLYVNWSELGRLNDSPTYGEPYVLPPEAEQEWARLLTAVARPEFLGGGDPRELTARGSPPWLARLPRDYPTLFGPRHTYPRRAALAVHEGYRLP